MPLGWQYVITGAIAGLVGLAEILTRYRSRPFYSATRPAALLYVVVNAGAGVLALALVRAFGWTFGQSKNVELWRILIAGFGAVALFRSSLFVAKVGNSNVNVGPSLVLQGLLDTFDRSVDRKSAEEISDILNSQQISGLNPDQVMTVLPVLCLALMQNFAPSDQALLAAELQTTRADEALDPESKMMAVVIELAKYLGPDLVKRVLTNARPVLIAASTATAALAATAAPTATAAVLQEARRLTEQTTASAPPAPAASVEGEQPAGEGEQPNV